MHQPQPPQRRLSPRSSLESLRREAKRWLRALRDGDERARDRLARAWPDAPTPPALRDVQHALAREHGLPGWTALVARVAELSDAPPAPDDTAHHERAARFLQAACLDWRVGGPRRETEWHAAGRLLRRHPELARHDLHTAVACGEIARVETLLRERPERATERGGPRDWPPLLYLCAARLPHPPAAEHAVALARLLLDHGADPNAYLEGGDPSIHYTALTLVLGRGEERARTHPQAPALAALLVERGAEPYDEQVLYNVFAEHDSRRLLSNDDVWLLDLMHARSLQLGRAADWANPEWRMLDMGGYRPGAAFLLNAAVSAGLPRMTEWMLAHGAGVDTAPEVGIYARRTPLAVATWRGDDAMAALLRRHGATVGATTSDPVSTFHDVLRRGDRTAARALLAAHPTWVREPRVLIGLAGLDDVGAMTLLLELGADPNVEDPTRGRERPLHRAALSGARRAAELLLAHGAEVDPQEASYGATPLGFARWAGATATIDLLRPISRDLWSLVQLGDVERLGALLTDEPALACTVTASGETLLMWLPDDEPAAGTIVELLLAHGADPSIRAADGTTAADRLRARGMDELAEVLDAAHTH